MKKVYNLMLALVATLFLSNISIAQDTTSYRMVSIGFGEFHFYNNDSTDLDIVSSGFSTGHVIFSNPEDSLLYAIVADAGGGDRNLFSINPFNGDYNLVADLTIEYANSGDLGEGNTLYLITGNGNATPGEVYEIDLNTFNETLLFTSTVSVSTNPTATEYNPVDSSLYIFEAFADNLYTYDLATGTESAATPANLIGDEYHGAFYDEINDVFHIGTYGGDVVITDNSYINGTVYNNSFNNVIDLCLIEHTLRADESELSDFCPNTDSAMISLIYDVNSFSWYKDGVLLPNAINDTIWVSEAGSYQALMEIGTSGNFMWSEPIVLNPFTVPGVSISSNDNDSLLCPGETITLTGAQPGGGSVQWYFNGNPINGETSQTIVVNQTGIYNQMKTNVSGCSDSSAVGFTIYEDTNCNSGIVENTNNSKVDIYPVPFTNKIIIEGTINIQKIEIYNISGKIVLTDEKDFSNKFIVNTEGLSKGSYIVKLYTKNSIISKHILK